MSVVGVVALLGGRGETQVCGTLWLRFVQVDQLLTKGAEPGTLRSADAWTNSKLPGLQNMKSTTVSAAKTPTGWSMVWGIIVFMCGFLAIALPLASSIGIVIVLGWLILLSAVAHLIFVFHSGSIGGAAWKLLLAAFYGLTGYYL